jgi:hypothetical protein
MVYLQTKIANLGIFWRALDWKMLIYLIAIWNILRTFEIFCDHLVHFVLIWHIFSGFGTMNQEKYGNPCFGHVSSSRLSSLRRFQKIR